MQKLFKDEGQKAILDPTGNSYSGGDVEVIETEQGLVSRAEIAAEDAAGVAQPVFDWGNAANVPAPAMSAEMRDSFLNIARALEEAQTSLGKRIGKSVRR